MALLDDITSAYTESLNRAPTSAELAEAQANLSTGAWSLPFLSAGLKDAPYLFTNAGSDDLFAQYERYGIDPWSTSKLGRGGTNADGDIAPESDPVFVRTLKAYTPNPNAPPSISDYLVSWSRDYYNAYHDLLNRPWSSDANTVAAAQGIIRDYRAGLNRYNAEHGTAYAPTVTTLEQLPVTAYAAARPADNRGPGGLLGGLSDLVTHFILPSASLYAGVAGLGALASSATSTSFTGNFLAANDAATGWAVNTLNPSYIAPDVLGASLSAPVNAALPALESVFNDVITLPSSEWSTLKVSPLDDILLNAQESVANDGLDFLKANDAATGWTAPNLTPDSGFDFLKANDALMNDPLRFLSAPAGAALPSVPSLLKSAIDAVLKPGGLATSAVKALIPAQKSTLAQPRPIAPGATASNSINPLITLAAIAGLIYVGVH